MDRRRMLICSGKVNVTELVFSYTGSYTDSLTTIADTDYRLLTFTTSGTLTLDQQMVSHVPFDAWVVAGGGDGGEGGSLSGYTGICSVNPSAGFTSNSVYHGCSVGCNIVGATAQGGGAGGDGGWNQLSRHIPIINSLVIDSGDGDNSISESGSSIISAPGGLDASGTTSASDQTRTGTAWFTLPTDSNGDGGAAGSSYVDWACATHDVGYSSSSGGDGGTGKPGIVYIRIPLKY